MGDISEPLRAIAAPFQAPIEQNLNTKINQLEISQDQVQFHDYRNFVFPALTPYNEMRFETFCGPTRESNWVIPNILLVGAYPASQDDQETFHIITSILKFGVQKFVCLQQEYRVGVPEELWRLGLALRPYYEDVQYIVKNKHAFPQLESYKVVDYVNLTFEHCPIVDCGVTDDAKVLDLSRKLVHCLSQGEKIYLHCWGGHGRTGTIVSIMLHLMYGLNANEAMLRCQAVHDLRECPVEVGSPQTQAQRDQVTRIINFLIKQSKPKLSFLASVLSTSDKSSKSKIIHEASRRSSKSSGTKSKLSIQNILSMPKGKDDIQTTASVPKPKITKGYSSSNALYDINNNDAPSSRKAQSVRLPPTNEVPPLASNKLIKPSSVKEFPLVGTDQNHSQTNSQNIIKRSPALVDMVKEKTPQEVKPLSVQLITPQLPSAQPTIPPSHTNIQPTNSSDQNNHWDLNFEKIDNPNDDFHSNESHLLGTKGDHFSKDDGVRLPSNTFMSAVSSSSSLPTEKYSDFGIKSAISFAKNLSLGKTNDKPQDSSQSVQPEVKRIVPTPPTSVAPGPRLGVANFSNGRKIEKEPTQN